MSKPLDLLGRLEGRLLVEQLRSDLKVAQQAYWNAPNADLESARKTYEEANGSFMDAVAAFGSRRTFSSSDIRALLERVRKAEAALKSIAESSPGSHFRDEREYPLAPPVECSQCTELIEAARAALPLQEEVQPS